MLKKQHKIILNIIFFILCLTIVSSAITNKNNKFNLNSDSGNSGSSSGSGGIYKYVMSTITTDQLSNVCPNENQVDYYAVSQCVDGFKYDCNYENQTVEISIFEDFDCKIFGKTQSVPFGCTDMYNSTYYYTCVEDISPMTNSYSVSSFNDRGCDQSELYHQKFFKLDNCNNDVSPILIGSCNSTFFSYTFYNDTLCQDPLYSLYDPLNTCSNNEVFNQSYYSQCII
ncbi:hypothetical protein DICPUDRAFT_155635 [Dictyostelium purpureum]|uniref:Transmembrane protein n=1 Tax=Dictyostelium purpureum TaxID=5786 RepID=F0ZUI5_DICPU|nr:uncharacterized protein DICPUDRAFT_155635 [Dictyostelium purpureum]EGC32399.1 hypothetical protein DICPUDRAFT_155635 [Dictyostelium purpureum]|eukprot:XP_003291085.1 hypothetical protein DICPUDRAFT_155635 [Dictyostelium purpureum]